MRWAGTCSHGAQVWGRPTVDIDSTVWVADRAWEGAKAGAVGRTLAGVREEGFGGRGVHL